MKRIPVLTMLAALVALWTMTAFGAVPQLINFQGILRDGSGNPVANGSYSVQFTIYDAAVAGTNLWQETQTVNTVNGLFSVLLGSGPIPLDYSIFNDSTRWLGVKVGADPEMTPRQRLSSVGYSHNSSEWTSAAQDLFRLNGNVGIGTSAPFAKLDVQTSGSYGIGASGSFTAIAGFGGTYGVSGSGTTYGVYGSGNSYGVYGSGNSYGVYGHSSGGAAAVYGDIGGNFGTYGGYFQGDVRIERNLAVSTVYASSGSGPGVVASGSTNGVEATGGSRGVYASGGTIGVLGVATSNVFPSYGVYGSDGGNSANTLAGWFEGGVRITQALTVGGSLSVDGFIFKNGGGFKIDHPTDPANKYLYHSFVESPDMKNIYDGVVTTDAKGEATVTLPDWFDEVNMDFRYQLTAIGQFAQAIISKEISNNRFSIQTDKPNVKISWQVTGIRKDAYAEAHRIPVEEAKSGKERGKYLHPEEFGVSKTLGLHYEESQKMTAELKKMEEQNAKMEAERKRHEEERAKMEQERVIQEQKIKEKK